METGFVVPTYIKAKICRCNTLTYNYRWSEVKGCETCKTCGLFPPFLLRSCAGCGITFIYNFYHPAICSKNPLCWECVNNPLSQDLLCYSCDHFLTYFYDAEYKGMSWEDGIREPKFEQPVAIDISNFKFGFEVS